MSARGKSSRWRPSTTPHSADAFVHGVIWCHLRTVVVWAAACLAFLSKSRLSMCGGISCFDTKSKMIIRFAYIYMVLRSWVYWSPYIYHHRAVKLTLRPIEYLEQI